MASFLPSLQESRKRDVKLTRGFAYHSFVDQECEDARRWVHHGCLVVVLRFVGSGEEDGSRTFSERSLALEWFFTGTAEPHFEASIPRALLNLLSSRLVLPRAEHDPSRNRQPTTHLNLLHLPNSSAPHSLWLRLFLFLPLPSPTLPLLLLPNHQLRRSNPRLPTPSLHRLLSPIPSSLRLRRPSLPILLWLPTTLRSLLSSIHLLPNPLQGTRGRRAQDA